ncbi:hypothetical protein [Desulfotignum balticum]|uniref:hypothetical protein n=1 Tax=Desulfotignum balticum TaxID=115781 RepID=UPI000462A1B4|nr:hypothetical protein [Desulfotignum balticum]
MSLYAVVTFDLEGSDWKSYDCVKEALSAIGIKKTIQRKGSTQEVDLPRNMFVGRFEEEQFEKSGMLRDHLRKEIERVFEACSVSGPYFVFVGKKWAWRKGTVTMEDDE